MFKKIILVATLLAASFGAHAALLGDYAPATNVCGKFSTYRPSTGAAFTLAGTPALSVYKDNSTTQSTTGVTLTADFDSVTGLNHFCIDTSADGTFYAAGSNFDIVITTGTVDSVSVVGSVVGTFTVDKVMALKPATAGRKVVIDAAGLADANAVKVGPTGSGTAQTARDLGASVLLSNGTGTGQISFTSGVVSANDVQISGDSAAADELEAALDLRTGGVNGAIPWLGIAASGTAVAYTAGTPSVTLAAATAAGNDDFNCMQIAVRGATTDDWVTGLITDYDGASDIATLYAAFPNAPTGAISYIVWGTACGSSSSVTIAAGGITAASFAASAITATVLADDSITASKIATDAIGANEIAAAAISSSEIADGAITSAEFAAGAITATVIATDAITATKIAADSIGSSEISNSAIDAATFAAGAIDANAMAADSIGSSELAATAVDEVWDEAQSGHLTAGTFGAFLDASVSGVSTGGLSLSQIANAVWDLDATAHQTQGTFGQVLGDSVADSDSIWSLANTNLDATVSSRSSQSSLNLIDAITSAIKAKTDQLTFGVTGTLNVNVEYQNAAQMCGNGTSADKWRACP